MRRLILLIIIMFANLSYADGGRLPDLGDPTEVILSPQAERVLGQLVIQQFRQAGWLLEDDAIEGFVREVGQRLVGAMPDNPQEAQFYVVKDPRINAFALPGGYIGIHTGLMTAVRSEDELASVMAHELAHVKQRHLARMYGHQQDMTLAALAGVVAATALATQNPEAGTGAFSAVIAGAQQHLINFTRFQEIEADHVGMVILAKAGFDPSAMPRFFSVLNQYAKLQGGSGYEFLQTHPLTEHRLASAWQLTKTIQAISVSEDPLTYYLVEARLLMLSSASIKEARQYLLSDAKIRSQWPKAAKTYGLALSYLLSHQNDLALKQWSALSDKETQHPFFELLRIEILLANGDIHTARQQAERALQNTPDFLAMSHLYGEILIQEKDWLTALTVLTRQKGLYPQDAKTFWQLSQVYAEQHLAFDSHLAMADYRVLRGELQEALTQLRMAQSYTKNNSAAQSRLDAKERMVRDLADKAEHAPQF